MFSLPPQVNKDIIKKFTKKIRQISFPQHTWIEQFYDTTLKYMLLQKNVVSDEYSGCLAQLLVVLYQKIKLNPLIQSQNPLMQKTMSVLLKIIDRNLYQPILNKIHSKNTQELQPKNQVLFSENNQINQQRVRSNQIQQHKHQKKIEKVEFETNRQTNSSKRTTDCIGCYEYFYQKQNIHFNNKAQNVYFLTSAKTIKYTQQELKQKICNILNNNGGFVLFACNSNQTDIVPEGQSISEVNKQSILQKIIQIFSSFYPKLSFHTNAQLSFVPIAKKSQQFGLIEGIFVTRLKIWSNNQKQILYFYDHMGQLLTSYSQREQNRNGAAQCGVYKHRNILRQIKRRFKIYYWRKKIQDQEEVKLSQNKNNPIGHKLLQKDNDFMLHKCKKPMVYKNLVSTSVRQIENISLFDLQKKYKYSSIIILQKISSSKVVNLLVSQNISRFQFMPSGTEFSNQIRLLFHDTTPHKLKEIFEHCKLQKGLLRLLLVDNSIQLKNPLKKEDFQELASFLRKILNINSSLKYYENKTDQTCFLYCQSKVEIYYVFNKLRQMNFHGSRLVILNIYASPLQQIYSA